MPYSGLQDISVCYVDSDGSGHYNGEDSVILTFRSSCFDNAASNDVRLAHWLEYPPGERLRTGTDRGMNLEGLTPEPRFYYFDEDTDNNLSPGDPVYLRMQSADQDRVRSGDVRITSFVGHDAGSRVASGDADMSRTLRDLGTANERIRHTDVLETDSFDSHDALWLGADISREAAGRGDIRIYSPEPTLAFGEALDTGDLEPQDTVRSIRRYLCMTDESSTGVYAPGDPLYLSIGTQCTGGVQPGDLRLSGSDHGAAGSHVQDGDGDAGARFIVLPDARVGYIDNDEDSRLSRGDFAVLRIKSPTDNALRAGDILLTPTNRGEGTVLREGDPLLGTHTRDLGRFEDLLVYKPATAGSSLKERDPIYISPETSTDQGLPPGAIRLTSHQGMQFGGPAGLETGELRSVLTRTTAAACTTELIGEEYNAGDSVYLRLGGSCPNQVTSGLLRLVPVDTHEAFSIVRSGDSDVGMTLLVPETEPRLRYYTVGESGWGYTTRLFLNLIDPENDRLNPGDIRLTASSDGQEAGRSVTTSDPDRLIGSFQELGLLSDHIAYIDMDRDGSFGTRDKAYILPSLEHEYVTPLSVRLASLPGPFEALSVPEPGSNGDGDGNGNGDTDDGDGVDDGDGNGSDDTQGDSEEEATPAPAIWVVGLLVALLVAVARARRD